MQNHMTDPKQCAMQNGPWVPHLTLKWIVTWERNKTANSSALSNCSTFQITSKIQSRFWWDFHTLLIQTLLIMKNESMDQIRTVQKCMCKISVSKCTPHGFNTSHIGRIWWVFVVCPNVLKICLSWWPNCMFDFDTQSACFIALLNTQKNNEHCESLPMHWLTELHFPANRNSKTSEKDWISVLFNPELCGGWSGRAKQSLREKLLCCGFAHQNVIVCNLGSRSRSFRAPKFVKPAQQNANRFLRGRQRKRQKFRKQIWNHREQPKEARRPSPNPMAVY